MTHPPLTCTIWQAIRRIREARNETQAVFARALGVSEATPGAWERGAAIPEPWAIQALAKVSEGVGSISEQTLVLLAYRAAIGVDKPLTVLYGLAYRERARRIRQRLAAGETLQHVAEAYAMEVSAVRRVQRSGQGT